MPLISIHTVNSYYVQQFSIHFFSEGWVGWVGGAKGHSSTFILMALSADPLKETFISFHFSAEQESKAINIYGRPYYCQSRRTTSLLIQKKKDSFARFSRNLLSAHICVRKMYIK
jgi:hypothetical protein